METQTTHAVAAVASTTRLLPWDHGDGGRATERGYGGTRGTGDCVPRAIAIATNQPYRQVHKELGNRQRRYHGRSVSNGTYPTVYGPYLAELGWVQTLPNVPPGHRPWLLAEEPWLPMDRPVIVAIHRHLTAVMYGVLNDTYDCSKRGTVVVEEFWTGPTIGRFGQLIFE